MNDKKTIKAQFGANAASYVISQTHAKGKSLARLLDLVQPQSHWNALDIATATGHTAFAFAPYVQHVWATDITPEMLDTARQQAGERGVENATIETADAEALPYEDAAFDLVTCRIAPHHFGDVGKFVREAARVLKSGGTFAVVDNIVPHGYAGDYVNAFEMLRDPSHGRELYLEEWVSIYKDVGLEIIHTETLDKEVHFEFWAKRHPDHVQGYLRVMLMHAPKEAAAFLNPRVEGDKTYFNLREGIFIGRKNQSTELPK